MRQPPGQTKVDDFSTKGVLNVAWTVAVATGKLFLQTQANPVIDLFVFLTVQSHCIGGTQSLVPFFSSEFLQAFQVKGMDIGDKQSLVYKANLGPNDVLEASAIVFCHKNAVRIKRLRKKLFSVEIAGCKPAVELRGVENFEK